MGFKWRDEHTERFVEYYKEQECLWNISSEFYKHRTAREMSYNKIREDLNLPGLTVADIKNKIKIIRTNYKIELNKIIRSEKNGSGLDDVYIPSVFWFKKVDSFLRGISLARESRSNMVMPVNVNVNLHEEVDIDIVEETQYPIEELSPNLKRKATSQSNTETTQRIKKSRSTSANKKPTSHIVLVENCINKLQHIVSNCTKKDDEFDCFGKGIAIQLRKMTLDRALICQENLQAVMREERLYQLRLSLLASSSCSNIHSHSSSFNETSEDESFYQGRMDDENC